jgi:SAM-dependent methyltransferase
MIGEAAMTRDPYDERPYTEHAYAETHPSRVAAVARLSRWEAPPIEHANVLELGCGRGGNLLPMAAGLPGATFVGVDRSERQIDDARRVAAGAGVDNVTFVHASFEAFDSSGSAFDYVICHGVLSWIPASGRPILLERITQSLAAGGVAHVSFNVLPGWYERLAARDWLRFAASSLDVRAEGAAESLTWLRDQVSPEHADYRRRIEAVARRLAETDAAYARHEYFADEHHPLAVGTFLDEASAAGLTYLGDAIPATTAVELLADDARRRVCALDVSSGQQLVDFIRGTAFRRALLVRADEGRSRSWRATPELDRDAIRSLRVSSRLRPQGPAATERPMETFEEGPQAVQVSDPHLRRALHELALVAPETLPFDELARRSLGATDAHDASQSLVSELFDLWLATGAVDLLAASPALSGAAGERPTACPVARWHASHGGAVTNRLHQEVLLPDAAVRWVLARIDGTRTRGDLAREARSLDAAGRTTETELEQLVAASVDRLVACGLIVRE